MSHMTAIDFGITDSAATPKKEEAAESFPAPSDNEVIVKTDCENIDLYSRHSLENTDTASNLKPFRRIVTTRGVNHYRTRLTEANAFTLRYGLTRLGKPVLDEDTKQALKGKADAIRDPGRIRHQSRCHYPTSPALPGHDCRHHQRHIQGR